MIYAAILAGGTGTRMGGQLPKQFLSVGNEPVLVHSIRAFLDCGIVFGGIYVVSSPEYIDRTQALMDMYFGKDRIFVIEGGANRSDSLANAISAVLENGATEDDILITHDGARPFVTTEMICQNIEDTIIAGCAGCAVPAVDTILISSNGEDIDSIPPRSQVWHMQTPQGFGIGRYLDCYDSLSDAQKAEVTDACGVFMRAGHSVRITPGSVSNIKITYPVDLVAGDFIARNRD